MCQQKNIETCNFLKIRQYIDELLEQEGIDVRIKIQNKINGFAYRTEFQKERLYVLDVEEKRLSIPVKLTLRHEIGHILFYELWLQDQEEAREYICKIKKHKIFCILQKFYYWNPVLRWIKRKLGYSSNINYTYDRNAFVAEDFTISHGESEMFADFFALFGNKYGK